MRRSQSLWISVFQGFQRFDQNTSPGNLYSTDGWSYQYSQVMAPPVLVNRVMTGPFKSKHSNVNRYRKGVWVDLDMHPAMRVALEPYLQKLQLNRTIPNTDPKEAASDFNRVSPLVGDDAAKLNWLAKVIQLCGHKKAGDVAVELWSTHCSGRFMVGPAVSAAASAVSTSACSVGSSTGASLSSSSSSPASALIAVTPPIGLIEAILYATAIADKPDWKPIFQRCLKDGWNITPKFSTRLWMYLLQSAGQQNDAKGVRLILDEMLDVQANFEHIESPAYVRAFNAMTDPADYNYIKKFLFTLSPSVVERVHVSFKLMRGHRAESLEPAMPDNEKMFYHVAWHNSIRQPQRFSPRQLYFNYKPNFATGTTQNSQQSGGDVLKEKISKWKEEGLLPEDYEFEGEYVDKSARFKQTMRHEHWAKLPKILKNPKYGYCGEH